MKKLLVDYRISDEEKYNIEKLGFEVLVVPPCNKLYEAVCGHPDILLHVVDEYTVLVHRDIDSSFVEILQRFGINVLFSNSSLQSAYALDIGLNAVNLQSIFLHNLKYTDDNLKQLVQHKKLINVKQGYTKCSTAIVTENAVMTSDKGIAKALNNENIDVLLLPPGDIILPGLDYGFIGGTCGLIEESVLAFYGDLTNYTWGSEVLEFLKKHKVEPVFFGSGKLVDRGSIFRLK